MKKTPRYRRRRSWRRLVTTLAAIVVFCTTYALILPAITMERESTCGMEEHIHEDACYASTVTLSCGVHSHGQDCYDETGALVCGIADYAVHAHSPSCYSEIGALLCSLPEIAEHIHGEDCVQVQTVVHNHDDSCMAPVKGDLICTREEIGHSHEPGCMEEVRTLLCPLAEGEGHAHGDGCYEAVSTLVCTLAESEGHLHGDACLDEAGNMICALEETQGHFHDETCRITETVLVCTLFESEPHTHSEACWCMETSPVCGLEETGDHIHEDACYAWTEELICGMEEGQELSSETTLVCTLEEIILHTHSESCYGEDGNRICGMLQIGAHIHSEACLAESEEKQLICVRAEHAHDSIRCYIDKTADVETEEQWRATLPALSGQRPQDLVAVAGSQVGYGESTRNYAVDDAGNVRGYTRYGAWYGAPYDDWNVMFVSFCLHYAGVNDFPTETGCAAWVNKLSSQNRFGIPSEYVPDAGDIFFLDEERDGSSDRVGIVETVSGDNVVVIEGNSNDRVERNTYSLADGRIAGYGILAVSQSPTQEESVYIGPDEAAAWAILVDPAGRMNRNEVQSTFDIHRTGDVMLNSTRSGEDLYLTPYIINVNMYDEDGNLIPSGSVVTEGDVIEFRIQYTVTGQQLGVMNGQNLTVYSDTLTYDLPKNFKIVSDDSGSIINSYGEVVGSYVIDSVSGTITMTFLDDFVTQNANGVQIQGYISFFSTVTKISDDESEDQDYEFKDGITLGVTVQEKNEAVGDLTIEKKTVKVVGEEIEYEIIVKSAEGTKGPVTITDTMAPGLKFLEGIAVRKDNGAAVNATFAAAADRQSFTMTLPEMAAGESYTVRYKCKADIDLLDADMTARNTATVTGKDSQDHELKDETRTEYQFDVLKKTGTDNGDGTITWTITVNQAKADISGWVLTDIIGAGNNSVPYNGTVTIKDSRGNVIGTDIVLPYTFPNGSDDTYTVTYTTTHDLADGHTIYNKAILSDEDTEVNDFAGVGIIGSPFTKTGEMGEVIQDADGNYLLPITWTVTIDTTSASIPGNSYFMDILEGMVNSHAEDMYMTYGQLMSALESFEAETMRITGEEVEGFSAWMYMPGNETGQAYNIIQLWNNVDDCQSAKFDRFAITLGPAGIPKGNVLTFSYEAYGVFPNGVVSTETFANRFSLQGQYEVEVPLDYVTGSVKATKYAFNAFDPTAEGNPEWKWGSIDWGSVEGISRINYENLFDSYLSWAIELSVPPGYSSTEDIILYEDLPDGVSVKRVELPFQDGIPTPTFLYLSDMAPGNTYSWDFTLYPADQYGHWQPQGAEPASITVHVTDAGDLEITIPGKVLKVMGEYAALKSMKELYGYLYIYTQINEDAEWLPSDEGADIFLHAFENRFSIKNEDGVVLDVGSQTQVIRKDESTGAIRKEATVDENSIVSYSVVLNAYGRDLIENAELLHVNDELTYTSTNAKPVRMRLVPGSVKLYEISLSSDGKLTKLRQLTANYTYNEISVERADSTDWIHTIDLDVPDNKKLLLEYSYLVSGTENETLTAGNTCAITGVVQGSINDDHDLEMEVKKSSAQADAEGVTICKVDSGNYGVFLKDARFHIYIWNKEQQKYIPVHHHDTGEADFVTDTAGRIVLDSSTMGTQFAYNTAYYIVEVASPNGYIRDPVPYYFQIVNLDTVAFPSCLPENFTGRKLTSGDIIYRENVSNITEISVEKYWQDYGGNTVTVTGEEVTSVTLELWQMFEDDPESAKLFDTYVLTPDDAGNWSLTIRNLPKSGQREGESELVHYLYYFKEVAVNGYRLESSENNEGINSGLIRLYNREQEGYELPETGGSGTILYTMGGLLLMITAGLLLMYNQKKRRREAY